MQKPLCETCRHGTVMCGAGSERRVYCGSVYPSVRLDLAVFRCTDYHWKGETSISDMEKVAWTLELDKGGRVMGFAAPKPKNDE